MSYTYERRLTFSETLKAQWRIILAIMLRDIKTRFFGSAFGFILVVAWPLTHLFVILLVNAAVGRATPFGDSAALWFATGLVPYIVFQYMARFTMLGLVLNRPLLVFPVVKSTDILFARAIIEILNAGVLIGSTAIILTIMGVDVIPIDIVQACFALGSAVLLGFGFGIVNAVIAGLMTGWITGYALLNIVMWLTSGVLFVPDALPEVVRYYLSYNPCVHTIEWMRLAYYDGYTSSVLDKVYLLAFGSVSLLLGLVMERLLRGRLLQ